MGSRGPSGMSRRMWDGMLVLRLLKLALASLACAWVIGVPLYYAFTLDLRGIEALSRLLTDRSLFKSVVFLIAQFVLLPFGRSGHVA